MLLNACCTSLVWLALDCPVNISTTLGASLPLTASHDTVRFKPCIPNNLLCGVTLFMLHLDGGTVWKTKWEHKYTLPHTWCHILGEHKNTWPPTLPA